jgi:hypothetical protein
MRSQEQLLLDTGRVPLLIRFPVLFAGAFFLWVSAHIVSKRLFGYDLGFHATQQSGSSLVGFIGFGGLGLFFISIWFLRNRVLLDPQRQDVVMRHWGFFGRSERRFPLAGARCIYVRLGRALSSKWWDIGIEFQDGRTENFARVYSGADEAARVFSDATRLPVVRV